MSAEHSGGDGDGDGGVFSDAGGGSQALGEPRSGGGVEVMSAVGGLNQRGRGEDGCTRPRDRLGVLVVPSWSRGSDGNVYDEREIAFDRLDCNNNE